MDLVGLVEQVVGGLGYELVDLETSPKGRLMRVFIDIEARNNRGRLRYREQPAHAGFEVENVDYDRLEVSSPGLGSPTKKESDFERFAGRAGTAPDPAADRQSEKFQRRARRLEGMAWWS